jgi:hypothetical protein
VIDDLATVVIPNVDSKLKIRFLFHAYIALLMLACAT